MALVVKNTSANVGDTGVQALGWEDPLEEGMATHSSVLAWRIPWTEEAEGLQSMGSKRVWHDWSNLSTHAHISMRDLDQNSRNKPKEFKLKNAHILNVHDHSMNLYHWGLKQQGQINHHMNLSKLLRSNSKYISWVQLFSHTVKKQNIFIIENLVKQVTYSALQS